MIHMTRRDISTAIDVASDLERLTETQLRFQAMDETDLIGLPSSEQIRTALRETLEELGTDSRYSDAAALITAAFEKGDGKFKNLSPFGYALQLVAESKKGCSDAVHFQETARFLLAKNDYKPVRTQTYSFSDGSSRTYDFFTDNSGRKVVALSKHGINVYTAELKDKYRLDDYINDFLNYERGTSRAITAFKEDWTTVSVCASMATAGLTGLSLMFSEYVIEPILALERPDSLISFLLVSGTIGVMSCLVGAGTFYGVYKCVDHIAKKALEKTDFPHTSLTSGIYALVDAVPLTQNSVSAKGSETVQERSLTEKRRITAKYSSIMI